MSINNLFEKSNKLFLLQNHIAGLEIYKEIWFKYPKNTRLNQTSSVKPPSQSSIVINTQSKISLDSTKVDSVSKGENKNLFKRMTGFFGKVIKNEETPPSGPKS